MRELSGPRIGALEMYYTSNMIPAEPVVFWQYFDVIVISIVSVVVLWLVLTHKSKKGELLPSISQTIAADKRSSRIFSIMMTVCVPLYYAFIWFWVAPLASAPWYFYGLLVISVIAEMIFVWVPATLGRRKLIHEYAAGFVGIVMIIAPLILIATGNLSGIANVGIGVFIAITLGIAACLLHPKLRNHSLVLEIIYCIAFWAVISLVAHT